MAWKQTVIPKRARDGLGWCLRQTQKVFGAPVLYPSARKAWDHQQDRHPGQEPPEGVAVPVWFDHYGTYGKPPTYGNWGHACTSLGDGRYLTSPLRWTQLVRGYAIYSSRAKLMRALGGSPKYLGWSESMNGKRVVEKVAAATPAPKPQDAPTVQKRVGSRPVNVRSRPSSYAPVVRVIKAGSLATISGYTKGQRVRGKTIWYKVAGGWAHRTGFRTFQASTLRKLRKIR